MNKSFNAAASGKNEASFATQRLARKLNELPATEGVHVTDKLIDFRRVHELLGLKCVTGHSARSLARRGLIRSVYFNERTIRYSEQSVLALVAGRATENSASFPAHFPPRPSAGVAEITGRKP